MVIWGIVYYCFIQIISYSLQLLFLELDEHVSSYSILLVQLQDVEENLSVPSVLGMFGGTPIFAIFVGAILVPSAGAHC